MEEFFIRLTLENGEVLDLPCKDVSDYARKAAFLDERFPQLDWRELRIPEAHDA